MSANSIHLYREDTYEEAVVSTSARRRVGWYFGWRTGSAALCAGTVRTPTIAAAPNTGCRGTRRRTHFVGREAIRLLEGSSYFPNIIKPYESQTVAPGELTNSPRLQQLIREGKLMLSLQDAIALSMENTMYIVVQRYNPWLADAGVLKARAGGISYGNPGANFAGSTANVPTLLYDPYITQYFLWMIALPVNNPFVSGTGATGTQINNLASSPAVSYC